MDRCPLATLPTPLEPMDRLGAALGLDAGTLWVKRDDLTGLAGGGNKARKLEHLVAEALAQGCDTLVTAGAIQSNHVRMTAAAACRVGMRCVAVLNGDVSGASAAPEGNLVLDRLFGAELVLVGDVDSFVRDQRLAETCVALHAAGARPYEIPVGGASPVGTLGYVRAAAELSAQAPLGAVVYCAVGTGGTYAGLAVGLGSHDRVRGVAVGPVPELDARIDELVPAVATLAGVPFPSGQRRLDASQIGEGYGIPTPAGLEAIALAARWEGLVLDPVYTAKACAALVADCRAGRVPEGRPIVFLHSGGLPSIFAGRYAADVAGAGRTLDQRG
ncbi:MAG: D-cysteine desulfhydrase family protein [Acidimicrobiales bacterium]|nr:D-cysteine desulfhydrase family protein [Acidimicrobiales bacterium]